MRFRDRADAGRRLAARLLHLRDAQPLVLALPRGGVPVALPVAEALSAPLDLLLVRKIGAPGNPEFGIGAVVEGDPPRTVLNEEIVRMLRVSPAFIAEQAEEEVAELERRRRLWGGAHAAAPGDRTVIVVDDGIATGGTARAALVALEQAGARRRVLAAPVASPEAAAMLRRTCDEAVFLIEPPGFHSVGAFYDDFRQLDDAEVAALRGLGAV